MYGTKIILLGDPPSAAVDRTESSGFRQCEPSPSWKQWIAIAFFSEITAIFLGTIAKKIGFYILVVPELPAHVFSPKNEIIPRDLFPNEMK